MKEIARRRLFDISRGGLVWPPWPPRVAALARAESEGTHAGVPLQTGRPDLMCITRTRPRPTPRN